MFSIDPINIIKKAHKDAINISDFPLDVGFPDESNIFQWEIALFGPKDSLYAGGIFKLQLNFPRDYPNQPPEIFFLTPIYHINVNNKSDDPIYPLGLVFLALLDRVWSPEYTIRDILYQLYSIFYCHSLGNGISEMQLEYKNNKTLFELKARYFTKKYANPYSYSKISKKWDFSCQENDLKSISPLSLNKKSVFNDYGNDFIILFFCVYGIKGKNECITSVKCKLNELTGNVIERFSEKKGFDKRYLNLFIFNYKKLDFNISIGDNELKNKSKIIVIHKNDYPCSLIV